MRGQTEQVLFQSGERHPAVNRHTVVDHVKIRFLKINDTLAGGALHISVVNVPFLWNSPIEHLCACRNFM